MLLLGYRAMQEPVDPPRVSERDLEEVLLSLEAELYGPPATKKKRDDSTQIQVVPARD